MQYRSSLRERCFKLSLNLISLIDLLPKQRSSQIIGDQLLRSGMSIGANLTEGTASSSRREFKKYQEIALRSANESKYWLKLLIDANKANDNSTELLAKELEEISNMIASGIIKLKSKDF